MSRLDEVQKVIEDTVGEGISVAVEPYVVARDDKPANRPADAFNITLTDGTVSHRTSTLMSTLQERDEWWQAVARDLLFDLSDPNGMRSDPRNPAPDPYTPLTPSG